MALLSEKFNSYHVLNHFRYYLEPASPLKSINTTVQPQQQQQPVTNGVTKPSHQQVDNSLAVLKSIQLTPPAANNRHHHRQNHVHQNGFSSDFQNNNFFHQNGTKTNGSIKIDSSNDFVADFSKASIHNSNNSLNSTEGQVNGKTMNGISSNGDVNDNFADFENNKIYNAAGTYITDNLLESLKTFLDDSKSNSFQSLFLVLLFLSSSSLSTLFAHTIKLRIKNISHSTISRGISQEQ